MTTARPDTARPTAGSAAPPTPVDLFREHYRRLSRAALLLIDDPHQAEEIVQDAFVELVARWPGVDPAKAVGYLYRSVLNGGRSALRRRRTTRAHLPDPAPPVPTADNAALAAARDRALLTAVSKLPVRQRQALLLRFYSDLSVAETAAALQVSAAAVTMAVQRALKALRATGEEF